MKYPYKTFINVDNPKIVAIQAYSWVDRFLLLDETLGRKVIGSLTTSELKINEWREK